MPEGKYTAVYNFEVADFHTYFVSDFDVLVHNDCKIDRSKPHLEDGNLNEGWKHIDARHISGDHPKGAGDLFSRGTNRKQIEKAANTVVKKGRRISDYSKRMQTFEKKIVVNKKKDLVRVVVDSKDRNRIITVFPVRGGK